MTPIVDGRALFCCSLAEFPDLKLSAAGVTMRMVAERQGRTVPSLDHIDEDAEPLVVWVQQGHAVVTCPTCAGTPEEQVTAVWLEGPPLALCWVCGSGGHWRRSVLPERWDEIVGLLAVRPMAARTWMPGMTIEQLRTENARHGWGEAAA